MAKFTPEKMNVTLTIEGETHTTTYVQEGRGITFSSSTGTLIDIGLRDMRQHSTVPNKPVDPVQDKLTAHEKLVEKHAEAIAGVLKAAETARINTAHQREKFEADIADKERVQRSTLRFAVHNAIQAGLDMEEVSVNMRDDHAGYVSDMADQVYLDTDLDTLVNVS